MPLMRNRILGYDAERMAFKFTMLNKGEMVECEISSAAMDELASVERCLPSERLNSCACAKRLNVLRPISSIKAP